jgi:hypothetical protein
MEIRSKFRTSSCIYFHCCFPYKKAFPRKALLRKTQFLRYPYKQILNKYPLCHLQSNYHLQSVFPYVSGLTWHQKPYGWEFLDNLSEYPPLNLVLWISESVSFLSSVLIAFSYHWFPFFLSDSIVFLIPLGTWAPKLY